MASILISLYQPIIANNLSNIYCFYEGLVKELEKNGNSVLIYNTALESCGTDSSYDEKLIHKVRQFAPDLIITFNNQINENVIKVTDCPVLLFDADGLYFFKNLDLIRSYAEKYYMITSWDGWEKEDYCEYKSLGFLPNRIHSIHLATSVKCETKEKIHNISFIGSKFGHLYPETFPDNFFTTFDKVTLYQGLQKFWNGNDLNYKKILKQLGIDNILTPMQEYGIFDTRVYVLTSLLDLGLKLHGANWDAVKGANISLALAFDTEPKFSLQHNQDVYNSSKINISISHPQTYGYAFPWRVFDIMASDGLLITSKAILLESFTHGHVNIPSFVSPYEARDLCKKYLQEENLRKDIVAASNEYIEKYGRWDDNIKKLAEISGVPIYNAKANDYRANTGINTLTMGAVPNECSVHCSSGCMKTVQQRASEKSIRVCNLLKQLAMELFFTEKISSLLKKCKIHKN